MPAYRRPRRAATAVVLSSALVLGSCGQPSAPEPEPAPATTSAMTSSSSSSPEPPPPPTPEEIARQRVPEELRAKIASLMMVGVTNYDEALAQLQRGAGGIFIPSWADPALLTEPGRDIAALREAVDRPFSVSIDFEGGRVQRHSEILGSYPSAREMSATMSLQQVEDTAYQLGNTLREHGITVDFAPVLDVDVAELDVIGDRSFSADPEIAGMFGAAFARGLRNAGVAPVYKHFPGHGRASGDTHLGSAVTPPVEEVLNFDAAAYATALAEQPAAVMVGHMVVPGLGDGTTPSSLDPAAYRLLREGAYPGGQPFHGVIYTDDLSGMRAITDQMGLAEAVAAAIAAGADQALWSSGADFTAAVDAVENAVVAGQIPAERIDESAFRVQLQTLNMENQR